MRLPKELLVSPEEAGAAVLLQMVLRAEVELEVLKVVWEEAPVGLEQQAAWLERRVQMKGTVSNDTISDQPVPSLRL